MLERFVLMIHFPLNSEELKANCSRTWMINCQITSVLFLAGGLTRCIHTFNHNCNVEHNKFFDEVIIPNIVYVFAMDEYSNLKRETLLSIPNVLFQEWVRLGSSIVSSKGAGMVGIGRTISVCMIL